MDSPDVCGHNCYRGFRGVFAEVCDWFVILLLPLVVPIGEKVRMSCSRSV